MKNILNLLLISGIAQAASLSNSATLALSTKSGNTNVSTYNVSFSSASEGDIELFNILLKDSEMSFNIAHERGTYQGNLLENNGQISLVFDYHANQTFSPFIFTTAEYDSMASLDLRSNLGIGAKWRFTKALSISIAGLFEREKYIKSEATHFGRISIRPKYKRTFDSGISVSWLYFYQPATNDLSNYLLDNSLTVSLKTGLDWLSITLSASDQFNSKPPAGTKKRDASAVLGFTANF